MDRTIDKQNEGYNVGQRLGALEGSYGVKLGPGYFLPHAVLLLVALLGFAIWWGSNTVWKQYVSFGVFLLLTTPFIFALWKTVPRARDKLSIYENGFIYLRGRTTFTCRWDEIKDFDGALDEGRRLKITAVEKHSGEKISFAYKLGGLDQLDHEYFEYTYANIPESEKATPEDLVSTPKTLGNLQNTFHVKRGIANLWPVFLLMFPAFMGVAAIFAIPEIIGKTICGGAGVLPVIVYIWSLFSDRRDELKIYENGFSYRDKKQTVECLWEQIEDYTTLTGPFAKLPQSLISIKKANGPWISIDAEMQGKEWLEPHLRIDVKEWSAPEE